MHHLEDFDSNRENCLMIFFFETCIDNSLGISRKYGAKTLQMLTHGSSFEDGE